MRRRREGGGKWFHHFEIFVIGDEFPLLACWKRWMIEGFTLIVLIYYRHIVVYNPAYR